MTPIRFFRLLVAATAVAVVPVAHSEMSAEDLAKLAQNPVGNLISVPFQNNTNLNFGPEKGTQNILNIQPVYPIEVSKDRNIITRTIVPLIWNPSLGPGIDGESGLGDVQFSAFLSPANPGNWIWGVGAIAQLPTNSDSQLGNRNWGLGPTAVVLHLQYYLCGNTWFKPAYGANGVFYTVVPAPT
jgi:hypothetical protein